MDDEEFARMLQQQLLDEERKLMESQQAVQQPPSQPSNAQNHSSEAALGSVDNLDPDLALARQMQGLEPMGTGYNQEEEDARLARLMEQSGQSLRYVQPPSSAPGSNAQPTPQRPPPNAKPPPQYSDPNRMNPLPQRTPQAAAHTPQRNIPRYQQQQPPHQNVNRRSSEDPRSARPKVMPTPRSASATTEPGGFYPGPLNDPLNPSMAPAARQTRGSPVATSPKMTRLPARVNNFGEPPMAQSLGGHGTNLSEPPMVPGGAFLDVPEPVKKKEKKKKRGILSIFGRAGDKETAAAAKGTSAKEEPARMKTMGEEEDNPLIRFPIPKPVPRPADTIGAPKGPLPYSLTVSKDAPAPPEATVARRTQLSLSMNSATCAACMQPAPKPLSALGKKYHIECFRCITCHETIDPSGAHAFFENNGDKQPMHQKCYAEMFGVKCAVCKQSIPAGPDGKVSFVKHPFFDTEQMCPKHARSLTRRCTGCHRFEPEHEPFADLNDAGRCVCFSCCRSVIVDSADAQPLWVKVVDFFEKKLNMPIWKDFREVPILVVGYNALNDQMNNTSNVHGGSSQIMTRGLCLTEYESGRRFRMNKIKFDKNNKSFVNSDAEDRGFTYFQVPDASKVNPDASVTAILCLSGLPHDLSASVLAHEATHAWIKLHPRFDFERPIPPQVEEGCAQLISLLFLNDGLDPPPPLDNYDGAGPSDAKLRQYFKFSIETDDHEIYGTGYRRAAMAYAQIGIEALLSHIVLYQDFPEI